MTTFIKAKLNKTDDQTRIKKTNKMTANISEYQSIDSWKIINYYYIDTYVLDYRVVLIIALK